MAAPRMQSAHSRLGRNSAVERARDAQVVPNASVGQPVPQLPTQCSQCLRWVDRDRLAVTPVGAAPMCGLCLGLDQVADAVKTASLSREKEDEALEAIFELFELLRGR